MSDIVSPIELKEVLKEEHKDHEDHKDHEEHEDHTTKPEDNLEKVDRYGSGFVIQECATRPGGCNPPPPPPGGPCTAAIFTHPSVLDAVVRNTDCDSHATLTSGSV